MEKLWVAFVIICIVFVLARGCSEQSMAKNWGGETNVTLEPNQKLVEITWKDSSLWYLTRPMRPDEEAETYIFKEQDTLGMMEGSVIVTERKMDEDEYQEYISQTILESDYYKTGNIIYDESTGESVEAYITYDFETGTYIKIKPYTISEDGSLKPAKE